MANKRGQAPEGMTYFVVFIIIIVMMGVFIALSFGVAGGKKPALPSVSAVKTPEDFLLLKEIEVEDKNEKIRKMTVFYALAEMEKGKIDPAKFVNGLDVIVNEQNSCLIFDTYRNVQGYSHYYHTAKFNDGKIESISPGEVLRYKDKLMKIDSIFVGERKLDISSYYGDCIIITKEQRKREVLGGLG